METDRPNTNVSSKEERATIDIVKSLKITVDSLGTAIGELKEKIDSLPSDYVKSEDIEAVLEDYFKTARIYSSTVTADIPRSLYDSITGLKKDFKETRTGIDESIAGIKPRKPLLKVSISNRFLMAILGAILISVPIGALAFLNSPMYLAHKLYLQSTYGDIRNPGIMYNDVYWSAYFTADGSIWITDSEKIVVPLDAEKTLTSKKVKWEKVNNTRPRVKGY